MIRRALGLGMVGLLLLGVPGSAAAPVPEGPRVAIVKFGIEPPRLELLTVDARGALPVRLVGGGERAKLLPFPLAAPSWSPDGSQIAFTGWIGATREKGTQTKVFVMSADSSGLHAVPGTTEGYGPVFAPDGHTLAFARLRQRQARGRHGSSRTESAATIWLVDLAGGPSRRLTPWRDGLENLPSSFSPDGTVLALSRDRPGRSGPEAVAMRLDGTGSTVLARNASQPVYSPDGSEIALTRLRERAIVRRGHGKPGTVRVETTSDLFAMNADGSQSRRLTKTPGKLESWPSWDPSGERLAYAQFGSGSLADLLGLGNAVMQINADGSCRKKLLSERGAAFYGPAWQPGPGREAGRIECAS